MTTPEPTPEQGDFELIKDDELGWKMRWTDKDGISRIRWLGSAGPLIARLRTELARRDEVIAAARVVVTCCDKGDCGGECLDDLSTALACLDAATPAESGPSAKD